MQIISINLSSAELPIALYVLNVYVQGCLNRFNIVTWYHNIFACNCLFTSKLRPKVHAFYWTNEYDWFRNETCPVIFDLHNSIRVSALAQSILNTYILSAQ